MPDSIENALEIRDVEMHYGAFQALKGITANVEAGTITGLLGPSGSGKTSLIRIIGGLQTPTRGEARVLGRLMPDRSVAREIGYMPQSYALYSDLTVRENVSFYAALYGIHQRTVIDSILEQVDLVHRVNSQTYLLSGGERRRASLAIALVHDPRVLLLDEPTVGLDPRLRLRLWDEFRARARSGVTILVSSHVMGEMERCDQLLLLAEGTMLAMGSPDELRERAGSATMEEAFMTFTGGAE